LSATSPFAPKTCLGGIEGRERVNRSGVFSGNSHRDPGIAAKTREARGRAHLGAIVAVAMTTGVALSFATLRLGG